MQIDMGYFDYQYKAVTIPRFVKGLIGGFGAGKSETLVRRGVEYCYENPGIPGIILSPTLPMAKRSVIPAMIKFCASKKIPCHYNKTDHIFSIFNSTIWIISTHDPDNIKGPTCGWLGIDEPFLMPESAYDFALSRVRDKNSTMLEILLAGTPEQLNWGYKLLVSEADDNVGFVQVSSRANPELPEVMLDTMERKYDKKMIAAYMDGEFVLLGSVNAFYAFSDENIMPIKYESDQPLILTCDFNKSPMSWNIMQETYGGGQIISKVFDEIHVEGTNTFECLDEFVNRWKKHSGLIFVSGDYSGNSPTDTVATLSNFEAIIQRLQKEFGNNKIDLQISPNPLQATRMNLTNGAFCNALGKRRLFIDPSCVHTIEDTRRAVIKEGTKNLDKNKYDPHHMDAIGYRIWYANNNFLGVA